MLAPKLMKELGGMGKFATPFSNLDANLRAEKYNLYLHPLTLIASLALKNLPFEKRKKAFFQPWQVNDLWIDVKNTWSFGLIIFRYGNPYNGYIYPYYWVNQYLKVVIFQPSSFRSIFDDHRCCLGRTSCSAPCLQLSVRTPKFLVDGLKWICCRVGLV